jgi:hypothetical protein
MDDFDKLIKKYTLDPKKSDIENFQKNGQALLNESFKERIELHNTLKDLSNECKIKMKEVFLKMREREDFIGAHYYTTPQITADSVEYKKAPLPIYEPKAYAPFHLTNSEEKFEFKTGDILITKGISFTSATISEVASQRSLFSHIVFIYVDEKTKKVSTMESYIGYGVKTYSIEEALRNENARILVLRMKDQKAAASAASFMYEKIMKLKSEGKTIPYDYELNFEDNTKLSCEEIAYDAFKETSQGKIILPENKSVVKVQDTEFLKKIGVKPGALMLPVDLEIDSRFDIVLDWTDYKIIRDSLRKDAIMGVMFQWMNEHHYRIHQNFRSIAARIVWSTRFIPGLWNLMSSLSGIPTDFKKDVPPAAISTIEGLKSIAGVMLEFTTLADEEFHRQNNRWMTPAELRQTIDTHLKTHPQDIINNFHE